MYILCCASSNGVFAGRLLILVNIFIFTTSDERSTFNIFADIELVCLSVSNTCENIVVVMFSLLVMLIGDDQSALRKVCPIIMDIASKFASVQ